MHACSVRTSFNIAIGADGADTQRTARSALLQMLNTTFKRVTLLPMVGPDAGSELQKAKSWDCCLSNTCPEPARAVFATPGRDHRHHADAFDLAWVRQ